MPPKRRTRKDTQKELEQAKHIEEPKGDVAPKQVKTRKRTTRSEENKENEGRDKIDGSPKRKFESINDSMSDTPLVKRRKEDTDKNDFTGSDVMYTKYKRLKELRETGPERALREYKKVFQSRIQAADALVQELSNSNMEDTRDVEKELEDVRDIVDDLTQELQDAAEEIKMLRAKLYNVEKERSDDSDHTDHLALSLSSDLTGLVIQSIDRQGEATVYDCLQKGRRGVFHYMLTVNKGQEDQQEIIFTPVLDAEKDSELISLLPDYFSEPLSFMRDAVS